MPAGEWPASSGTQTHIIPRGTFPSGSAPHLLCASSTYSSPRLSPKHNSIVLPSTAGTLLAHEGLGTTVNIL